MGDKIPNRIKTYLFSLDLFSTGLSTQHEWTMSVMNYNTFIRGMGSYMELSPR